MLLSLLLGNVYDDDDDDDDYDDNILGGGCDCNSTWSYENRVSKHFVNLSQLPLSNSLFTVLFAYVVVFACFVLSDLCRSACRRNYYLTPPPPSLPHYFFVLTHSSLFNTTDSYLKSVHA